MRDEKKIVLVMLEPSEVPGTPETVSASESAAAAASLHTASRSRRSDLRAGRPGIEDARRAGMLRAAAPAPSADLVRFQFIVITCRLLRFPAVVPLFPAARGSVPGVRISGPLVATLRSGPRQENRVLLSLRSGAVVARHAFAFDPARPSRLLSAPVLPEVRIEVPAFSSACPPGSPPFSSDPESVRLRRPKFPVYHPGPASCSARLLFNLFMVCISKFMFRFRSGLFSLVRFGFVSFSSQVRFVSVSFLSRFPFGLSSLSLCLPVRMCVLFI